jgi:hypothetical protein
MYLSGPGADQKETALPEQSKEKTGLKGFEPLTCGLRVRRYAELSYRPKPVRPNNVVYYAE